MLLKKIWDLPISYKFVFIKSSFDKLLSINFITYYFLKKLYFIVNLTLRNEDNFYLSI